MEAYVDGSLLTWNPPVVRGFLFCAIKIKKTLDYCAKICYTKITSHWACFFYASVYLHISSAMRYRGRLNAAEMRCFCRDGVYPTVNYSVTGGADMRVKVTLACTECKQRNYYTVKNKKNDPDRLEMKKYCRFCKKHTSHKESK